MGTSSRDADTDSVKGALILLVVAGHIIDIFSHTSAVYRALDAALTAFRMPLFLLIVGMYARATLAEKDYRAMFCLLVLPLVVFQAAYLFPLWLVTGKLLATVTAPYFHLWFLQAIILMKLALTLAVRVPCVIGAAVGLTLLAGYDAQIGASFALSRTLYFFPFFLAGHLYGRRLLALVRRHPAAFGALFLLVMAGIVAWSCTGLAHNALNGNSPYAERPVLAAAPALGRALALALSLAAALGFVALVPRSSRLLVYLGQRSMVVYLCHGFFILALGRMVQGMSERLALWLLPAWLALAVALACALARFNAPFKACFTAVGERLLSMPRGRPLALD